MKNIILSTSIFLLSSSIAFADKSAVIENYANIALAKFEDSVITAKKLQTSHLKKNVNKILIYVCVENVCKRILSQSGAWMFPH